MLTSPLINTVQMLVHQFRDSREDDQIHHDTTATDDDDDGEGGGEQVRRQTGGGQVQSSLSGSVQRGVSSHHWRLSQLLGDL